MFENNKKPFQDETFLRCLRDRTNVEGLDNDTMRSVYISHFCNSNNSTWKQKETMANKMRHDPRTAQHKYLRVVEKTKTDKAKDEIIKQLEEANKNLMCELNELKINKRN